MRQVESRHLAQSRMFASMNRKVVPVEHNTPELGH